MLRSGGGSVEEAIADAELLIPFRPEVVIEQFCASSCANYLLPIASKVLVKEEATIAYHGTVCEISQGSLCTLEQDFWKRLPNPEGAAQLPLEIRKVTHPEEAIAWMPTEQDFAQSGFPQVVYEGNRKMGLQQDGVYLAPIPR